MSFASGFYGRVADNMRDKKQFIRQRVEEDRLYLRQQGLQRQAAVTEQRTRYQQATEQLMRIQGVDKDRVLAALEADPDGILDLAGRDFTNGSQINTVLEIYGDTEASGSLTDILGKVMPTFSALPADADPTTVRRAGLAGWLGLDTETELNEQVYGAQIVGGMTGDQILASMNIPVTAQGTGSRGMNYEGVEDTDLTSAQRQAHFNDMVPEYDAMLEAEITRVQQSDLEPDEKMKQVKELRDLSTGPVDTRLQKLLEKFGPTDNSKAFFERFGENLFSPGMARFFSTTQEDNTQDPNVITTTELPEAGTAELPKLEADSDEAAVRKANAFWADPINDGVDEIVTVIDGEEIPMSRPFGAASYETTATRANTDSGSVVYEEYTVRASPIKDAEAIIQNQSMSNAEKAQQLALIQKYLMTTEQTPDVVSDLEFITPYLENFLEG